MTQNGVLSRIYGSFMMEKSQNWFKIDPPLQSAERRSDSSRFGFAAILRSCGTMLRQNGEYTSPKNLTKVEIWLIRSS